MVLMRWLFVVALLGIGSVEAASVKFKHGSDSLKKNNVLRGRIALAQQHWTKAVKIAFEALHPSTRTSLLDLAKFSEAQEEARLAELATSAPASHGVSSATAADTGLSVGVGVATPERRALDTTLADAGCRRGSVGDLRARVEADRAAEVPAGAPQVSAATETTAASDLLDLGGAAQATPPSPEVTSAFDTANADHAGVTPQQAMTLADLDSQGNDSSVGALADVATGPELTDASAHAAEGESSTQPTAVDDSAQFDEEFIAPTHLHAKSLNAAAARKLVSGRAQRPSFFSPEVTPRSQDAEGFVQPVAPLAATDNTSAEADTAVQTSVDQETTVSAVDAEAATLAEQPAVEAAPQAEITLDAFGPQMRDPFADEAPQREQALQVEVTPAVLAEVPASQGGTGFVAHAVAEIEAQEAAQLAVHKELFNRALASMAKDIFRGTAVQKIKELDPHAADYATKGLEIIEEAKRLAAVAEAQRQQKEAAVLAKQQRLAAAQAQAVEVDRMAAATQHGSQEGFVDADVLGASIEASTEGDASTPASASTTTAPVSEPATTTASEGGNTEVPAKTDQNGTQPEHVDQNAQKLEDTAVTPPVGPVAVLPAGQLGVAAAQTPSFFNKPGVPVAVASVAVGIVSLTAAVKMIHTQWKTEQQTLRGPKVEFRAYLAKQLFGNVDPKDIKTYLKVAAVLFPVAGITWAATRG